MDPPATLGAVVASFSGDEDPLVSVIQRLIEH
jgi:hypothetical protein